MLRSVVQPLRLGLRAAPRTSALSPYKTTTFAARAALASQGGSAVRALSASVNESWGEEGNLSKKAASKKEHVPEVLAADHSWRQTNHIWTEEELQNLEATRHVPVTFSDHVVHKFMRVLYHSFNFITGYDMKDPSNASVGWRLIVLESFAGVPGFVAAGFRHFYSLRTLQRDHGSIYTFLEEAENERMHLLVCMKMYDVGFFTKALVITAQISMTPVLLVTYAVKPQAMHRFVGYLEETACETYMNLIEKAQTPGTKLHAAWDGLQAPDIAKSYWHLADDATWIECLRHILADETHHRDVNHTFGSLPSNAENPFIKKHMADFEKAVKSHVDKKLAS